MQCDVTAVIDTELTCTLEDGPAGDYDLLGKNNSMSFGPVAL